MERNYTQHRGQVRHQGSIDLENGDISGVGRMVSDNSKLSASDIENLRGLINGRKYVIHINLEGRENQVTYTLSDNSLNGAVGKLLRKMYNKRDENMIDSDDIDESDYKKITNVEIEEF